MTNHKTVGILGGGISGLTLGYLLQKGGIDVAVYEKESSPGGVIRSVKEGPWLVEFGPNTILSRSAETWKLIDLLDLRDQVLFADEKAKRRYIVRDQQLHKLPDSPGSFLTTGLLSWKAKGRLLAEPFIRAPRKDDESIASFFRRRLGTEPLEYGVNPFVSGIYAGTPESLSVKHTFSKLFELEQQHGSILKGMIKQRGRRGEQPFKRGLISFEGGLSRLVGELADRLGDALQTDAAVGRLHQEDGRWTVTLDDGRTFQHRMVVSTLPVDSLKKLNLPDLSAEQAARLEKIDYAPVSVLALGYERDQIGHPLDGFGALMPEAEPYYTLGVLFSSTLFSGRAPDGHALLTCFIGGQRHPEMAALNLPGLEARIIPEISQLLEIRGAPVFTTHRYWPRAIPQYHPGYDSVLQALDRISEDHPGLLIDGNIRGGVSLPDRIASAYETTSYIEMFLQQQGSSE